MLKIIESSLAKTKKNCTTNWSKVIVVNNAGTVCVLFSHAGPPPYAVSTVQEDAAAADAKLNSSWCPIQSKTASTTRIPFCLYQ